METAIVAYSDMRSMAKDIATSGLFGMKNETQVLALMSIAQAEGKHPAIVARDYDIIQGRPAKKAEAMLRDFLQGGGKVEWHTMTDECADATFSHPMGGTVRVSWDMKRATQAELKGKDMYRKYPRQMLRARTVSEGVRAVGPFATSGLYVPEEVREFDAPKNGTVVDAEVVIVEKPAAQPDGYEQWKADMSAVADNGTAALLVAWNNDSDASKTFRRHAVKADASWWAETKAKAAQVPA